MTLPVNWVELTLAGIGRVRKVIWATGKIIRVMHKVFEAPIMSVSLFRCFHVTVLALSASICFCNRMSCYALSLRLVLNRNVRVYEWIIPVLAGMTDRPHSAVPTSQQQYLWACAGRRIGFVVQLLLPLLSLLTIRLPPATCWDI